MSARVQRRRLAPARRRRGSVILFVLGVVLLAAFLLMHLVERAGSELLVESRATRETALRARAYTALEVTAAVLADVRAIDGGLHAPAQGWSDPLAYAGFVFAPGEVIEVTFEDETGKLPLATADEVTLQRYGEAIGLARTDAERLADALLVWMRPDHLPAFAESDPARYENLETPYAPPERMLRSFEELRAVAVAQELFFHADGSWNELGERFRADASLHRFNRVNINTARPSVLVALGLTPDLAIAVAEAMGPADGLEPLYFRDVAEVAAGTGLDLTGADVGAAAQCLRIRILARQGAVTLLLEAVLQAGGGGAATAPPAPPVEEGALPVEPRPITRKRVDYPFRVLELRERLAPLT